MKEEKAQNTPSLLLFDVVGIWSWRFDLDTWAQRIETPVWKNLQKKNRKLFFSLMVSLFVFLLPAWINIFLGNEWDKAPVRN